MSKINKSLGGFQLPDAEEDNAIKVGIANDPDALEMSNAQFKKAKRGRPFLAAGKKKQQVTMLLDPDIIAHLKKDGRGWQTRANLALRKQLGL